MEDSSEDLPKPPRRTAARPFFSPRPEGVTGPLELSRRRAAQLFTPPGSSPGTSSAPAADKPAAPESTEVAEQLEAQPTGEYDVAASDAAAEWMVPTARDLDETRDAESLAQRNTMDDGDQLFVEQFEPEEIELTSASATTEADEHSIEVIAYDDANSLLKAAASEGERPQVDGLHIETTEFSFQGDSAGERALNIESFWATEPFGAAAASAPAESSTGSREEREVEHAEMALDDSETVGGEDAHPLEWGNVDTMRADPAPRLADSTPPWVGRPTPASSQSLEELKEAEPWAMTPAIEELSVVEPAVAESSMEDESMEDRFTRERAIPEPPSHAVADVLERLAARVRAGSLDVPSGSGSSDAAALAAVLTALLRQPH